MYYKGRAIPFAEVSREALESDLIFTTDEDPHMQPSQKDIESWHGTSEQRAQDIERIQQLLTPTKSFMRLGDLVFKVWNVRLNFKRER